MFLKLALPMLLAFLISFFITPIVIKIAHHVNAVDIPNDDRRIHKEPIPRLGGLAIFVSVMLCFLFSVEYPPNKLIAIIVGALLVVLIGIVDDIAPVKAKYKLIVQIVAALVLFNGGIKVTFITSIFNAQQIVNLGEAISFIITILWVVGITNTLNLIDGLDGLSGGIATISATTLAYVAYLNGRTEVTMITLIIAGACIGFLPYNFNPARIFMGDTGALFLGFMLAAISIEGTIKITTAFTFFAPVLALGIPIFDTFFSIVRRTANGRHPFEADKGHLHHRVLALGYGQKRTVLYLYLVNSLFGVGSVFLLQGLFVEMIGVLLLVIVFILIPIIASRKHMLQIDDEKEDDEYEE